MGYISGYTPPPPNPKKKTQNRLAAFYKPFLAVVPHMATCPLCGEAELDHLAEHVRQHHEPEDLDNEH